MRFGLPDTIPVRATESTPTHDTVTDYSDILPEKAAGTNLHHFYKVHLDSPDLQEAMAPPLPSSATAASSRATSKAPLVSRRAHPRVVPSAAKPGQDLTDPIESGQIPGG